MSYWFRNPQRLQLIAKYNHNHGEHGLFVSGDLGPVADPVSSEKPTAPITSPDTTVDKTFYSRELAHVYADQAKAEEPEVTKDLESVLTGKAQLVGTDYKLKTLDSLARKIVTDATIGNIPLAEAASRIRDALRYTIQAPTNELTDTVKAVRQKLKDAGYTETKFKNSWGPKLNYQGINANYKTPSGYAFELQFHTPESFHTKEIDNHPLYEENRKLETTPARKAELETMMIKNQEKVKTPPGITDLK